MLPMRAGLVGALAEGAFVDADFEAPLIVHADDADEWEVAARRGFKFRDVEHERAVRGDQHAGAGFAGGGAVGQHGTRGVRQAGADMAKVLVPDHVMRFALRIGPLENDGGATVADHDAVFRKSLRGFHDETRGVDRQVAVAIRLGERFLGELVQFGLAVFHEFGEAGGGRERRVLQGRDELRDDATQVTDQRHVDWAVDADGGGILFDINPLTDGFVLHPVAPAAVMHGLAELGAERQAKVGFRDGLDRGVGEDVLEGAVFQAFDVGGATGGLNDRAVHQQCEFLDGLAPCGWCGRHGRPGGWGFSRRG